MSLISVADRVPRVPSSVKPAFSLDAMLASLAANFELVAARTPDDLDAAARLRYEVYCEDRPNYEDPANFPDRRERDSYDARSLQVLLRFKPTPINIGTVRLVTPIVGDGFMESFSIQKLSADPRFRDQAYIAQTCEISRFCISQSRRRKLTQLADPKLLAQLGPYLKMGLIAGIVQTATEHRCKYLCAVTQQWLTKSLADIGILFQPVGKPVEFHGLRQPGVVTVAEGIAGIKATMPEAFRYIEALPPLWPQAAN